MTERTRTRPARLGRTGQLAVLLNLVAACLTAAIVIAYAEHLTSLDAPTTARILVVVPLCLFAASIAFALLPRETEARPARQVRMAVVCAGLGWIPLAGSVLAPSVFGAGALLAGGPLIAWMLLASAPGGSRAARTRLLVVALALGGLSVWDPMLPAAVAVAALFAGPRWARRHGLRPAWAASVAFAGIPLAFLLRMTGLRFALVVPVFAALSAFLLASAARKHVRPRWIVPCAAASILLEVLLIALFLLVAVGLRA